MLKFFFLSSVVLYLGQTASATDLIANCTIVTPDDETTIAIEKWAGPFGEGIHFSPLFDRGELHFMFGQGLDGTSSEVIISRGRDKIMGTLPGVAFEVSSRGNLPLGLDDNLEKVSISCVQP